jgi:hypothetical protein
MTLRKIYFQCYRIFHDIFFTFLCSFIIKKWFVTLVAVLQLIILIFAREAFFERTRMCARGKKEVSNFISHFILKKRDVLIPSTLYTEERITYIKFVSKQIHIKPLFSCSCLAKNFILKHQYFQRNTNNGFEVYAL